jgi:lipoprotein-anchoring transpeptidase ErfK/SrfK
MKKIFLSLILVVLYMSTVDATSYRKHRVNVKPLTRTSFELTDVNFENPRVVDLKGKDFFVVSVREPGSDGRVYAVDRDGTIWWMGVISSGAGGGKLVKKGNKLVPKGGHETSNNIFKVLLKRRFHMSKAHPDPSGINNMDFELQFTQDGQALHLGNTAAMSHGCIHVGRQNISTLFKWAKVGMPVVVMRGTYWPFVQDEITQFKKDLKAFNRKTGSIDENIK